MFFIIFSENLVQHQRPKLDEEDNYQDQSYVKPPGSQFSQQHYESYPGGGPKPLLINHGTPNSYYDYASPPPSQNSRRPLAQEQHNQFSHSAVDYGESSRGHQHQKDNYGNPSPLSRPVVHELPRSQPSSYNNQHAVTHRVSENTHITRHHPHLAQSGTPLSNTASPPSPLTKQQLLKQRLQKVIAECKF